MKKIKLNKYHFIVITIIILGFLVRVYNLGNENIGFFRDEAAMGFNSISILTNLKDEYAKTLPVFFRSFEVFFMPLYVYISTLFFKLFGNSIFSARILSSLSGTALIFTTYLISKKIFKKDRLTPIVSALVVSISPWSVFYSRGAFEGNLSLFFFSVGLYLWLEFFENKKRIIYFLSLVFFTLSMYSYQAPRFVIPLFLIASVVFSKDFLKNKKLWISGFIFMFVLYLPVLVHIFEPASYHRAVEVSIFSSASPISGYNYAFGKWQYLYLVPRELLSLYLHYFSPRNLFWESDYNPQRVVVNHSVFYFWMFPYLIIGIYYFVNKLKNSSFSKRLVLSLLIISPIPAALTKDPFHTYRSIIFWLPLSIIIGYGISVSINYFKKLKIYYLLFLVGVSIYFFSSFLFDLFKVTPVIHWRDWDYGYRQVSEFVKSQPDNLRVVVDDLNTEGYIHFLFWGVIDINDYQKEAGLLVGDNYYSQAKVTRPQKIGRFEFRKVDWRKERGDKDTLFIFPSNRLYPSEFTGDPNLKLVKTVYSPGSEEAFYIIKTVSQ